MNVFNIERAFKIKKERGWDKLYWCIDLHDTIFKGDYARNQSVVYYPHAIEVLQNLSKGGNILIAYSSSYHDVIVRFTLFAFMTYGISFNYINENPNYESTEYADFSRKFYYNILLDDKAGFEGEKDWFTVKNELIRIGEWK